MGNLCEFGGDEKVYRVNIPHYGICLFCQSLKGMTNLKRDNLVLNKKIVPKTNMYPISVPMQATGNQYSPSVYIPQVNKSKHIEEKLVIVNTSSFCDLKKDINVGTNE